MSRPQFIRFKALDRCLRDKTRMHDIDSLVDQCNKALARHSYGMTVSARTVRKDLQDFQEEYGAELDDRLRDGHKKIYRYKDLDFKLPLVPDAEQEYEMLQSILNMLDDAADTPQYQWLRVVVRQKMLGLELAQGDAVSFQDNPDLTGIEHFEELLGAILARQPLEVGYVPYGKEMISYRAHPYHLKQFNNRWFLVARCEPYERLTILPLDRIQTIRQLHVPFIPTDTDFETYFDDVVGITKDVRHPVEDVLLRVSATRYQYVQTKPLHSTQTELKSLGTEDARVIRLRVRINNELTAAILQLGEDAEVLHPQSLRDAMAQKIAAMNGKYQNNANTLQS